MLESKVSPDRRSPQRWLLAALVVATAVCGAVAGQAVATRNGGSAAAGQLIGALLVVLALVGLPSLSIRFVARVMVVVTGVLLVRFGVLTGSLVSGDQSLLVWVVGTVAVFVLTDRLGTDSTTPVRPDDAPVAAPADPVAEAGPVGPGLARPAATTRSLLAVLAVVILIAVLLAPTAGSHMGGSSATGDGPRSGSDSTTASLRSADSLDMTARPHLGDDVVFTVATDRGTFWRGETFDQWDGRTWTRSQPDRYSVGADGEILPGVDDIGVNGTDEFTQRFRIESDYADVLYAAVSPVQVDAGRPVAQRFDGTLSTVGRPMGRGATYTVTSRRTLLSPDRLRAASAGGYADAILQRFASDPVTTGRVRAAATRATAGATNAYDKVLALERWMGQRTEYSLDAPLSPTGVDVVDHFLFTSRQGWCEQVASSLVVLARANGIPARLVTGFVPEKRDPVTGTYVVRSRDAHAWTEVWFPEVGWVPFDPTASVPLAGDDKAEATIAQWLADHAVILLLGAVALGLATWGAVRLARRLRRRRAERPVGWAASAEAALTALGARVDRPRGPGETTTTYAEALALRYGDGRLAFAGALVDDGLYAPVPPSPEDQAAVDALLAELAAAEPPPDLDAPEPVAAGVGSQAGGPG